MKTSRCSLLRAIVPIAIAVVALASALAAQVAPTPDLSLQLGYQDGEIVVASVDYGSPAQLEQINPGEVVAQVNGVFVLALSDQAKIDLVASHPRLTSIVVVARQNVAADKADYQNLVAAARKSPIPWLASPETVPLPIAATAAVAPQCIVLPNGGCAPDLQPQVYNSIDGKEKLCVLTRGGALLTAAQTDWPQPGDGTLCVISGSPNYYLYTAIDRDTSYGMTVYRTGSPAPILLGLTILILGWIAIGRGWAGAGLKRYALTLPVATAVPLLALPIDRYPAGAAVVAGSLLVPLAMLPLAIDFLGRIERRRIRWFIGSIAVSMAIASAVLGLLGPLSTGSVVPSDLVEHLRIVAVVVVSLLVSLMLLPIPLLARRDRLVVALVSVAVVLWLASFSVPDFIFVSDTRLWRAVLAGGVVLVPGLVAARPFQRLTPAVAGSGRTPRALVDSVDVALAAMTPGIAAIGLVNPVVNLGATDEVRPILVWIAVVLVASRVALRPLARFATTAGRQRDLVVAATEAERMRIAANIHDEALQNLTMLVRRLDAAGDTANAQAAREIAERLRALCGDLRLPVLDDLGVGPALEWLCGRLGSATELVTLDREPDESRLPADVELAIFRIAQEALTNAARHGAAPIVVRYRARPDRAQLEVLDSGAGIADGAAELAERTGHMGLMNMTQPADGIGARLEIARRPGGGTQVALVWEAAMAPAAATAGALA